MSQEKIVLDKIIEKQAEGEDFEGKLFRGFEKHQEFTDLQNAFLYGSSDQAKDEEAILNKLTFIFHEYLEQSYLLDPYLEQLVAPVVEQLKAHAVELQPLNGDSPQGARIGRIATLLYSYIKFRGHKTITRFFPHEIADLSIALNYLLLPGGLVQDPTQWPLRYVMLLWLSLICMLPFDLAQFDESDKPGHTAAEIEHVAKTHLNKAGIERDGAAILLARLYLRKDMHDKFPTFLNWCVQVVNTSSEPFSAIGCVRVLCEVANSGSSDLVQSNGTTLLNVTRSIPQRSILINNTIMRTLRTKLLSRVAIRLLPARPSGNRRKGRLLSGEDHNESIALEEVDIDVPEEVEEVLEELFQSLQDKDTFVRYSAAKGIARIAERLPSDFVEQVFDNVLQLFIIHSVGLARTYDMPAIAEATWHGACLACAEIARRSLVPDNRLSDLFGWMSQALYFDIRQGAHSIGSNVRDATSYVLWSLARAQSLEALAPYAESLSQQLVTVACFDREVHIRRAASAAFQEYVGRTSLFPHGIDVLRKTDFYAVGTRRHAYLVAAPEVAAHDEYRPSLLEHLITITIRHWDPIMRQLGANAIREICQLDMRYLIPRCSERVSEYLTFPDPNDIHGALLTLSELATACSNIPSLAEVRRNIFSYVSQLPANIVQSSRHELVTAAACQVIANSVSTSDLKAQQGATTPEWRKIIDFALKSRGIMVQESAADAMAALSKLIDCSPVVQRLIRDAKPSSPPIQQSLCRILGVLDYNAHAHGLAQAIDFLLTSVDSESSKFIVNIEARRNAYEALPLILQNTLPNISHHISSEVSRRIYSSLQTGLKDYTMDERGDVGSWIRMVCIKGLADVAEMFLTNASTVPALEEYLPPNQYHQVIGGLLKQGVERLDNVRLQAGQQVVRLLTMQLPDIPGIDRWRIHGESLMKELFLSSEEKTGWNEGAWLYPRAVRLLDIPDYREMLLAGFVLGASSKTDSTQRPVSASLANYAEALQTSQENTTGYSLSALIHDIITPANKNIGSNAVVIPALQTCSALLEADALEALYDDERGLQSLQLLMNVATRNAIKIKNVQRILLSMKVVVNLLSAPALREQCITQLPLFLGHQYPKVRGETAEYFYLALQSKDLEMDTDEVEAVLLETAWVTIDTTEAQEAAERCKSVLQSSVL